MTKDTYVYKNPTPKKNSYYCLTIKNDNNITNTIIFKVPNRAMLETYNNYFLKILRDADIELNDTVLQEAIEEMMYEVTITKITDYVSKIMSLSSNKVYIDFSVKYLYLLYVTLLLRNKVLTVYDEYPCGNGYADIMILRNSELSKYDIMIELKNIKKEDYTDDLLEQKRNEAKSQLKTYAEDDRIDKEHLREYVVIFYMSEVELIEEVK